MGVFEAAVAGGAGLFAYKKFHKSHNEKKRMIQTEQHTQSQAPQQPYGFYQNVSHDDIVSDNPTATNTSNNTRDPSPDHHYYYSNSNDTTHSNCNGSKHAYQPQPLTFQPASEKFRGQHLRIDTENVNGHYYATHRARQELYYLETCRTNPTVSGTSLHRCSEPAGRPRHQSSFVEDLDDSVHAQEKETAQCYYI